MPGVRQGEATSLALAGLLRLVVTAVAGLAAARRALRIAPGEVLRAA